MPRPYSAARFLVAIFVSAAVILSAPYIGDVRGWLRKTFPGQFSVIINGAVATAALAALMIALVRIRDRRAWRYGAIASAVGLTAVYMLRLAKGTADTVTVERFHFVEYGLVSFLFYRAWRSRDGVSVLVLAPLSAFIVGTIDEWFQWWIPGRYGELADVLLNGFAIASGLLWSVAIDPPAFAPAANDRAGASARPRAAVAAAAAIAVFLLAAFIDVVHLGYLVTDPAIGSFRSRFSAGQLAELSRDRAASWRTQPPIDTPPRVSREDQYLTEGLWHVQRRNENWTADPVAAWGENRILETYFAPVLDTPSYIAPAGNRWPPAQREDAARRVGGARGPQGPQGPQGPSGPSKYLSDAERYPILVWPRLVFWIVVTALIVAVLTLTAGPLLHWNRARGLS